jgi:hypothetical protein
MSFPDREKISLAYVWFANAVASEDIATLNHAKRLKLAREMCSNAPIFNEFIFRSMTQQGYVYETDQTTINDYMSALATNLITLGFGD